MLEKSEGFIIDGGNFNDVAGNYNHNVNQTIVVSDSALLSAWTQYEMLTDNKMQCKLLIQRCEQLVNFVRNQIQRDGSPKSMQDNLHVLESTCTSVRETITRIASEVFLGRLLHHNDISEALRAEDAKIQDAFTIFNVAAQIGAQTMAEASAQDRAEIATRLDQLSQNDLTILNVVNTQGSRVEELLVALMKHVQDIKGSLSSEDLFIEKAVRTLQRRSKEPIPGKIDWWQLTTFDVKFNRDLDSELGSGSFGMIYKGDLQGTVVAVKEMHLVDTRHLDRRSLRALKNEIAIWSRLSHPHILPFYGACLEAKQPFVVSRCCDNGTILDYLEKNTESDRLGFVLQISSGMMYLHRQRVVHADLKGVNILIGDDLKILISDFGVSHLKSRTTTQVHTEKNCGTLRWMCPELMRGEPVDFPVDVYAFAITVWELYTLEVPFKDIIHDRSLERKVIEERKRPQRPLTMHGGLWNLIEGCWSHEPYERPDFKSVFITVQSLKEDTDSSTITPTQVMTPETSKNAFDSDYMKPEQSSLNEYKRVKSSNLTHQIDAQPKQLGFWPFRGSKKSAEYDSKKKVEKAGFQRRSLPSSVLHANIQTVQELSPEDIIIAVMGPTGSGKSSFISTVTGRSDGVGHSLESCTTQISAVRIEPLELTTASGGVVFVDTPGFDDTNKSDVEVLNMISDWLEMSYKRKITLNGILYFHRIRDNRMAGTPLKNLRMFEKLCGKDACQKIVLTTTMWDDVDPEIGNQREKELKENYWKSMMDRGSKSARYMNTRESAWDVIQPFLEEDDNRQAMLLQRELVDLEMQLRETSAGKTLYVKMEELVKKQQKALQRLRTETKKSNDEETLNDLTTELMDLRCQLDKTVAEMKTLKLTLGDRLTRLVKTSFVKPRSRATY